MRFLLSAALVLGAASSMSGSVIFLGPAEGGGAGLGNRLTVLTLQSPANTTLETGCVGLNESTTGCGFADSDVKTGAGQIGSYTLADPMLGLTSIADLRIMFNAAEPGNSNGVTLNALVLTLYNTVANTSASFELPSSVFLPDTFLGIGQEGYMFGLDGTQAGVAATFIGATNFSNIVVGLGASVGCTGSNCTGPAQGGPDTFSIAAAAGQEEPPEIPEPSTYLMLLSGAAMIVGGKKLRG